MPINTRAKGKRHLRKILQWFRKRGYMAESTEFSTAYSTYDLWGSDGVARNREEIIFFQSKANKGHMAQGLRDLQKDALWPRLVKRWCIHWPARAKEPEVRSVD